MPCTFVTLNTFEVFYENRFSFNWRSIAKV